MTAQAVPVVGSTATDWAASTAATGAATVAGVVADAGVVPLVSVAAGTATGRDDTRGRDVAQAEAATAPPVTDTRRVGRPRSGSGTTRAVALGVVALAAVATLAAGCSATPSASSSTSGMPTVATGDVTCSHVTGGISFSPPLTSTGTAAQSTRISLTATGCTTSGSHTPVVTRGTAPSTTSACSGVLTLRSVALTIHWTPTTIRPSTLTFPGYNIVSTPSGSAGFSFPSSGGSASVVGSFAGSDRGAASTAALYFDPSVAQIQAVCKSSGLASLPVTSGTVTLK